MGKHYKLYTCLLLLVASMGFGQQPQTVNHTGDKTETRHIRIVDSLTTQEKTTRLPVLLKTEVDSLLQQWLISHPPAVVKEPEKPAINNANSYVLPALLAIILLLGIVIAMFYRHQKKISRTIAGLKEKAKQPEPVILNGSATPVKERKGKAAAQTLENTISGLQDELSKLSKENEGLNKVISEYNGIQQEYDSLKHGMSKAYKVKNYPGYDKTKHETMAMQGVLETENAVAAFAYEKFLKPLLTITDANKNNPARINEADRDRILDLLVSLSLLYIEYLYLRVNELAIGGKMVERIQALSKGKAIDTGLLKKLNTEFGSRALVLKMALDKAALSRLSYPVFDETNLNNQ